MKRSYTPLILFTLFIFCEKRPIEPLQIKEEVTPHIISHEHTVGFSGMILKFFAHGFTHSLDDIIFKDVQGIKIIYQTVDQYNEPTEASGMLMIPENFDGNGPLIFLQHSTLADNNKAPTNSKLGVNELTSASIMAAMGAVVVVPDFIGYGHSSNHKHLYQYKENIARTAYDFLGVADEYLKEKKITTNGDLFLTGYAQGADATLALHQKIEEENQFTVTHSLVGGGIYNINTFFKEIFIKNEDLPLMGTYVWILEVLNSIYPTLQRPMDFYFNEPYASNLSKIKTINEPIDINLIDTNPQKLFKKEFIDKLINGEDKALLDAITDQGVTDWKPLAPITIFQGTSESCLYKSNGVRAYNQIQARGGNITYVPLEGKNHIGAVIPYLLETFKIIFPSLR